MDLLLKGGQDHTSSGLERVEESRGRCQWYCGSTGPESGTTILNSGAKGSNNGEIEVETLAFYREDTLIWHQSNGVSQ